VLHGVWVQGAIDAEVLPMIKRQRLDMQLAAGGGMDNLADLEGVLEPQEFKACMAQGLLQQLRSSLPAAAWPQPREPQRPGLPGGSGRAE
jgi:hypothetical protein